MGGFNSEAANQRFIGASATSSVSAGAVVPPHITGWLETCILRLISIIHNKREMFSSIVMLKQDRAWYLPPPTPY